MASNEAQLQFDSRFFGRGKDRFPKSVSWRGEQLKVSKVFWTFWKFAAERQAIFFRRLHDPRPWTTDPILRTFRFTNAYRASDRVSQYLIREVAYRGEQDPNELFFRVILFKLFNKIETWELLKTAVGNILFREYDLRTYDSILAQALHSGRKIYSAAYIMPSGGRNFEGHKHRFHLTVLTQMMKNAVPLRIAEMKRMSDAFALLRSYPGIGDFLAYQFVTDLNYTTLCSFDEMEFVVPGPGATDGIRKCFPEVTTESGGNIIRFVTEMQERYFSELNLDFTNLWGRQLQLIDCQNLFCEVSKYARRAHPDVSGVSGRTRIKQVYRPSSKPLSLFYPPKWSINERIPAVLRAA